MDIATLLAASLGFVAAVVATIISLYIKRSDQAIAKRQRTTDFLKDQLDYLYLSVSNNLAITKQLFDRYSQADDDEEEMIEHAWMIQNSSVLESLTKYQIYLDPDAPKPDIDQLIRHLVQWELVYRLKYEKGTYTGHVFAGIGKFGGVKFPRPEEEVPARESLDGYFGRRSEELRKEIHSRLRPD